MLPQRQAAALGEELKTLTADDRVRLEQFLWQLRGEVRKDPSDLGAATALTFALSLAGLAEEARTQTYRAASLLADQIPTYPIYHLNVVHGLVNAGLGETACDFLRRLRKSDTEHKQYNAAVVKIGIMFADVECLARSAKQKAWRIIESSGLMPFWAAQQAAVMSVLDTHVASMEYETACLDGGGEHDQLVLTYNTDLTSYSALDALEERLWTALEAVYAEHPDGAGALLGHFIIEVRGPKIPLEDLRP